MRTISRWNPAHCDGNRTSTCWIPVGLRYSKARGVEVTGTLGDAFPPADPSLMGYYLADPVRLPIITAPLFHPTKKLYRFRYSSD